MESNIRDKKRYPPFSEEFMEWCIINNGMSEKSARVYVSNIRTAYDNFCYSYKGLFEILEIVCPFINKDSNTNCLEFPAIRNILDIFDEYIDDLRSLKDGIIILDEKKDEWKNAPVENWLTAFKNYSKFLKYKMRTLEHELLGFPMEDRPQGHKLPLKKQFFQYLKEYNYKPTTIWTYSSRLDKCILGSFELLDLEKFYMNLHNIIKQDDALTIVGENINRINEVIVKNIEYRKLSIDSERMNFFKENELHPLPTFITDQDLDDARLGLIQYEHFLKDIIKNPEKYSELLKKKGN